MTLFKPFMVLTLIFVVVSLVSCRNTAKIINGQRADEGRFPWQVAVILRRGEKEFFCGGALISNEWVLTAGHCALNVDEFRVILGGVLLYDDEEGKILRNVSQAIVHPDYDLSMTNHNDIALLRLDDPVEYTDTIRSVPLVDRGEVLEAYSDVIVSGWGKTEDRVRISPYLKWVRLRTISNEECAPYFTMENGQSIVNENDVCTTTKDGYGFCQGDSGGPLIRNSSGVIRHVAVVSFTSANGCLSGDPNGYVRTEPYLDWIQKNTGI